MMIPGPHLASFAVGALSLGQEVLWVRLYGFAQSGSPSAFSFVLAAYLIGIAVGAFAGKILTVRCRNLWQSIGMVMIVAGTYDLIAPQAFAWIASNSSPQAGALIIVLSSALKAAVFPIVHHLGTDATKGRTGRSLSRVYVANILGSTIGPIVVGFFLLDVLSTQQAFLAIAMLSLTVGAICIASTSVPGAAIVVLATVICGVSLAPGSDELLYRLSGEYDRFKRVHETRQGIVTIYPGGKLGDVVFGGNVYDGRTNLSPRINSNGLERILALAALKERPRHVLMIGLSIGTWLKLATSFPGVETIDVIEINPGYVTAIAHYPAQASALTDQRVRLHIDDGRRWLRAHTEKRYDLVIMNTTFHWRAYASNLLSKEFLERLRLQMNPGAILAYNATGSSDALFTASVVFPHAYLYGSFVFAADHDFRPLLDTPYARARMWALSLDGQPLFGPDDGAIIDSFLRKPFVDAGTVARTMPRALEVITDRNLITEYRYGSMR